MENEDKSVTEPTTKKATRKKRRKKLKSSFRKESDKLSLNAGVSLAIIIALIVYRPEWRWVAMGGGLLFMVFDIRKLFKLRTKFGRSTEITKNEFYTFEAIIAAIYIAAVPAALLL